MSCMFLMHYKIQQFSISICLLGPMIPGYVRPIVRVWYGLSVQFRLQKKDRRGLIGYIFCNVQRRKIIHACLVAEGPEEISWNGAMSPPTVVELDSSVNNSILPRCLNTGTMAVFQLKVEL